MADKNNYLGFNFGDFSDPINRTTGVPTKYLNLKGLTDFWAQIKSYIDAQDQNLFSSITSNSNKTLTIQGNGASLGTYNGLEAKTINITPENIGALSKGTDATKVVLGDGSLKPLSDFVTGTINETTISYADGILSMNFSDANVISYDNGTLNLTL